MDLKNTRPVGLHLVDLPEANCTWPGVGEVVVVGSGDGAYLYNKQ